MADLPSRDDFELLAELGSEWRDPVIPDVTRFDDDDAETWMHAAEASRHTAAARSRPAPDAAGPAQRHRRRRR